MFLKSLLKLEKFVFRYIKRKPTYLFFFKFAPNISRGAEKSDNLVKQAIYFPLISLLTAHSAASRDLTNQA